jgi:hypothetical protein
MSNNSSKSSEQKSESQHQHNQSTSQDSSSKGQRRSAPEYPPATPRDQRTDSANFGEGDRNDVAEF